MADDMDFARRRVREAVHGTFLVVLGFVGILVTPSTVGQAASGILMAFGALMVDPALAFRLPDLIRKGVGVVSRCR